jgi:uncharacterized protein
MIAERPSSIALETRLRAIVRSLGSCVVAFSGGVDSAVVLAIAAAELGDGALGVTGRSASLAERELDGAVAVARAAGAAHEVLATRELEDPRYAANPADRCYYCKNELYGRLAALAQTRGYAYVVDGFNCDDESDVRPGRKAAREFGVRSPLAEAGLRKQDVRDLARRLGLDVWDKPALACLSSRVPYGTAVTVDVLRTIERAERAVCDAGFSTCRVRHYGELARVELPLDELPRIAADDVRRRVLDGVRAAGYRYACVDLAGYVTGNLNGGA